MIHVRKRNVILTAKEVFARKGYQASSVQDIFEACNISKGTFYNYSASKNDFLISYLDVAREEEFKRRDDMLIDNDAANKSIFTKQILVSVEVMHEFNLRPIFEAALHSTDSDLKAYINQRLTEELSWLARRLKEIYGEASAPYASDCAIMMYGIIQHLFHAQKTIGNREINLTMLVQYAIRRMDAIIEDLIAKKDQIMYGGNLLSKRNANSLKKQQLLEAIDALHRSLEKKEVVLLEYADFFKEEIQASKPRVHLTDRLLIAFQKEASGTKYEEQVDEIVSKMGYYMNKVG